MVMAYVGPSFVHDLFVSYSHGDDGRGRPFLRPWSVAFANELENELRADRKFRKELRLFLDEDHRPGHGIDPMAPLTEQLRKEISASAVLVVLMSDDYLTSAWCTEERDWWCTRQTELGLPTEERIAVVRIWPTNEPWPAALTDSRGHPLVGFRFYNPEDAAPRPLGWLDMPGPFGSATRKALIDIVGWLSTKLADLKARLEERYRAEAEAAKLAQDRGQSIYLHGRVDQAQAWERTGIALTDDGFVVLPGEPDPVEHDPIKRQTIRERRVETLSACDALLLLGTDDSRALDADLLVVGKHDRQSARALSQRLLPCALLDTVGAPIASTVRQASARNIQVDWLDATLDPWTPAVQRWLVEKSTQASPES
jgi:hypothetical protein